MLFARAILRARPPVRPATRLSMPCNAGILRAAQIQRPSLVSSSTRTFFHFRRFLHSTRPHCHDSPSTRSASPEQVPLAAIKPRMIIGFTCKVCDHRQHKYMSKHAYEKGVVIIKCDGCSKLHLIADHLGWYDSQNPPGTIEDIMKRKGKTVQRLSIGEELTTGKDPADVAKEHEARLLDGADDGMLEFVAAQDSGLATKA